MERVDREGGYSQAFVRELKIFQVELRDFFNATGRTSPKTAAKNVLRCLRNRPGGLGAADRSAGAQCGWGRGPPLVGDLGSNHLETT